MYDPQLIRPNFKPGRLEPCFCESGRRFKDCCGRLAADRPPPQGVVILKGFLSCKECRSWVDYLLDKPCAELDVYLLDHQQQRGISLARSSSRVTDQVQLGDRQDELDDLLASVLQEEVSIRLGKPFAWMEKPQVLRYIPGGYFKKHADSEFRIPGTDDWVKNVDRDISILLYLNDNFSGGQLRFNHFNYSYQPRAGDLVYFPSDHRYQHEAMPLKSGVRYVAVAWAAFEGVPRAQEEQLPGNIPLS